MSSNNEMSSGPNGSTSVQHGPNTVRVVETTASGAAGAEITTTTTELAAMPSMENKFFQRMPEVPLQDFLTRPVKVNTFTLVSNSNPYLQTTLDPWALWLADPAVVAKLKNQTYIRGELEVEIIPNASPALYGCVDVSLMALMGDGTSSSSIPHPHRSREMTVAHVDLSLCNSVKLTIPWLWYYDYAALPTGPALAWQINVFSLHSFESGIAGGATDVRFTTYVRLLPGYSLAVTQYQGKGRLENWKAHAAKGAALIEERTKGFPRDGPVSSVASTVSNVAGKLKGLPVVGGVASMVEMGASAAAGIASFFGFSRAPTELELVGVRTSALDNPAATEVKDHGLPAALIGTGLMDPDPALGGGSGEDVLSWASLGSRPTYIGGATIDKDTAIDTAVFTCPVTPFWWARNLDAPESSNSINLPAVGWCGAPFSWWRGDLIYHVDVMAPTTARGTLQITWQPPSSIVGDATTVTANRIFDIGGYKRFEFKVGYAREQPFLPVFGMRNDTAIIPVGNCNGYLRIAVVNPILMVNDANHVFVRVWVSGGENMDFRVPASCFKCFYAATSVTTYFDSGTFRLQGGPGALGGNDSDFIPEQLELVPPAGPYPADEVNFPGGGVFSARAMVQKSTSYRIYKAADFAGTAATRRLFSIRGPQMVYPNEEYWPTGTSFKGFNYAAYYAAAFCGWAGAQHFAWHGWNPCAVVMGVTNVQQGETDPPTPIPPASAANFTGPNGACSFIIPYSSPAKFYPTCGPDSAWPTISRSRIMLEISAGPASGITGSGAPAGATAAYSGVLYHSYGPDFRVSQFRQTPTLVTSAGDSSSSYFGSVANP